MGHQGSLIGKIVLWLISALGVIFIIMIYSGNDLGIDGGLWITYIAFIACAAMALIFGIVGMLSAGKRALPGLIGLGGFLALLFISYAMADGSVQPEWNISESTSKWIGAGITMTGIAAAGAVVAIVFGEINRMFK